MMHRLFLTLLMLFSVAGLELATIAPAYAAPEKNCPTTVMPKPAKNTTRFEVGSCASNYTGIAYEPYEFTTKLVACMEGTVYDATLRMLSVMADEFGWVFGTLSTLIIIFLGIRIAMGERDIKRRTANLAIKLAFVTILIQMMPTIVNWVFGSLAWFMRLVTNGSPWQQIDQFLGLLVGFGPNIALMNGMLGMIGAATFSSTVGMVMFYFGMLALVGLINFILKLIYTYLLAVLTIGFMLILMPIVIPLSLFFYTENYFKKWCDIIVAAILTPVLIFAFVWMFLDIFEILIQQLFVVLGGNDFRAYWRTNSSLYSWMMPSDPNTNALMAGQSTQEDLDCFKRVVKPPVQSNINPLAGNAFDAGVGKFATLDFGANDVGVVQQLSFIFTTIWIFASLMKSMVELLPSIASSIASVSSRIEFSGNSSLTSKLDQGIAKSKSNLTSALGGGGDSNVSNFAKQMGSMLGKRDK